jgi:hypothetical protein
LSRTRLLVYVALLSLSAASLACDRLVTSVHLTVPSPDGSTSAVVLDHPSIDPPEQSIGFHPASGAFHPVRRLASDQDWCHQVFWSADSSTVVFLIQDARMVAYSRTGDFLADQWLVNHSGYPTPQVAGRFSLSSDGATATFRPCNRPGRGGPQGSHPCGPEVTIRVRTDSASNPGMQRTRYARP